MRSLARSPPSRCWPWSRAQRRRRTRRSSRPSSRAGSRRRAVARSSGSPSSPSPSSRPSTRAARWRSSPRSARGAASEGLFLASGGRIAKVVLKATSPPAAARSPGSAAIPCPRVERRRHRRVRGRGDRGQDGRGHLHRDAGQVAGGGASPAARLRGSHPARSRPSRRRVLNDRGDVAFLASVRRGRETVEAVYVHAAGKLVKVAAQGDPAPGRRLLRGAFGFPALNNKGAVAFGGRGGGPRRARRHLRERPRRGAAWSLARGEETPVGGIFAKLSERIGFNDAGVVAFHAFLKNGPVAAGVFAIDGTRRWKVAAIGDAAPGGGSLSHFGLWPALDRSGAVGFAASVDGGPGAVAVLVADGASTRQARRRRRCSARRIPARRPHPLPARRDVPVGRGHLRRHGVRVAVGDGPGARARKRGYLSDSSPADPRPGAPSPAAKRLSSCRRAGTRRTRSPRVIRRCGSACASAPPRRAACGPPAAARRSRSGPGRTPPTR